MPRSLLRNIKWHYDTNSRETSDKSWQQDYFSNSDKISGRTFDGNNELFFFSVYVCHFFLLFFTLYLHPPAAVTISRKNTQVWYFAFGDLLAEESPCGAPLPWDRTVGAQPSSCSGGDAAGAEQGRSELRAVPQVGTALVTAV